MLGHLCQTQVLRAQIWPTVALYVSLHTPNYTNKFLQFFYKSTQNQQIPTFVLIFKANFSQNWLKTFGLSYWCLSLI